MYRTNLGFVEKPINLVAMQAVERLFRAFNNAPDFPILSALERVADVKTYVTAVKAPQLLQIGGDPKFAPGSETYNDLHRLLLFTFGAEKLYDGKFSVYHYVTKPVYKMSEAIDNVVSTQLRFISLNSDLNGERTLWGSFCSEFTEWLHNIKRITDDRRALAEHLKLYMKHIVFKLSRNLPLDQNEKTFLCCYRPGSPFNDVTTVSFDNDITAQENHNPLVARDFSLLTAASAAGPLSKFFKLVSNQSIEQLTAAIIPGVTTLPLNVGSLYSRGVYVELDMQQFGAIPYSDALEVQGIRERLRVPDVTTPADEAMDLDSDKGFLARFSVTLPATVVELFPITTWGVLPFDLPEVEISLRKKESLDANMPFAGLRASWISSWRDGRKVHTDQGATIADLLTDLAVAHASYGSGAPINATLPESGVIDGFEPTIAERLIQFGSTRNEGKPSIMYKFFYMRDSKLESKDVDVSFFYARRGSTMIKPAFVEFVNPPMSMLFGGCEAAVDYVAGELGFTHEERKRNELALTVAFNYHETKQIIGATPPIRDLETYIATILAV